MIPREGKETENELFCEFGQDYISGMGLYLHCAAMDFMEKRELQSALFLDEHLVKQCLLDTLYDVLRLRSFHDITEENSIKLHSYVAHWWTRRKPFQRRDTAGKIALFANELFAANFLISALPKGISDVDRFDQLKASEIPRHLFYHLKYRNVNPQTLELFLVGLDVAK